MKHFYLLIEAGRVIDPLTNFYYVAVGSSRSDQVALRALSELSEKGNLYFSKRDAQASAFLSHIFETVPNHKPVIAVDVRDMVRHIKNGTRPTLSKNQLENNTRLMYQINLDFRVGFHA